MKYVCDVCGWEYDEEEAGVKWEDLPEDFACELCGLFQHRIRGTNYARKLYDL